MKIFGLTITANGAGNKRSYDAASKSRRAASFVGARNTGANKEIAQSLETLRNRSRHMVRNNNWAKRAVEAIVKHTIGDGIQPAPECDIAQLKQIRALWRQWAGSTACDWYGRTTFYGLQELAMRSIVEGGDVLVLKRYTKSKAAVLPLQLELLEGDRLDSSKNGSNERGIARMGVQYGKHDELLGYWILPYHPGDSFFTAKNGSDSVFVAREEVLHAFEILRVGQTRGIPFGVAAFMRMQDFCDYEDAQLLKQKVAACFSAFVKNSNGMDIDDAGGSEMLARLEPGVIEYLQPDEEITFASPPMPAGGDYDTYSLRTLQGIAAAYGITYEMLTMDYSRVNFTSGRMAKIDVSQNFKSWQYHMMVPMLCAPVWEWFVEACIAVGLLDRYIPADWTAPRVQQLDPVKETAAMTEKIRAGLATLSETIRELGREPEEFFAEYAQDIERLKKHGISVNTLLNTMNQHGTAAAQA